MHKWSARLLAIGLALVVLAPASSFASVLYACQMSGRTAKSCCCHAKHSSTKKPAPVAELEGPACCKLDIQEGTAVVSIAPELLSQLVADASVLELVAVPEQELVAQVAACEPRSRGPPGTKTPFYIRYCTLLN